MNTKILAAAMAVFTMAILAVAGDAQLDERRAKASQYESQADWKLQFEDWNTLAVCGKPETNGAVVTIHMIKAKDVTEALALAPAKKDLAVIIVSHRFHGHYTKDEGEKQLDTLADMIRKTGFTRIVFLSETEVGNLVRRE